LVEENWEKALAGGEDLNHSPGLRATLERNPDFRRAFDLRSVMSKIQFAATTVFTKAHVWEEHLEEMVAGEDAA